MYEVTPCTDYDLIKDICLDEEMLGRISDDFFDADSFSPELMGVWLRCDRGGECLGVLSMSQYSPLDLRVHIHILEARRINCLKIGKAFIDFIEGRRGGYLKMSTRIAMKYGNVIKFTKRLGFDVDGIDPLSYKRDGVIYDTAMLNYIFEG